MFSLLTQSSCGQNLKYTNDYMAICKSARQYSSITSQRTELLAVLAQSLNCNHVSFISSEAKPKLVSLHDVSEKDTEKFQKLMLPYIYVKQMPKKHVMDLLLNGFNYWMKLPEDKIKTVERIYSDMVDYTVLLDDWIDDSASRRNHPTAHRIYGPKKTSLASTALALQIMEQLREFENPMVIRWFNVALYHYTMAQNEELCWEVDSKCPTMSEYYDLIRIRLECYIFFIIQVMQSISECKLDLSTVLKFYCRYFQVQNDTNNFCNGQYRNGKGFGDDISSGRFTLPIIHAVNSGTNEGAIVHNILQQRTRDVDLIKYCTSLLEKLGSLEYAKQVVSETEQQFRAEIHRLGGNVILEKMIDQMKLWEYDEVFTDSE